jgi:hypothetical protein
MGPHSKEDYRKGDIPTKPMFAGGLKENQAMQINTKYF